MAISAEKRAYYENIFPRENMIVGSSSGDAPISQEEYDYWLESQPEPDVHAARENTDMQVLTGERRKYYPTEQAQIFALTDMASTLKAAGIDIGAKMEAIIDRVAAVKAKFPKPEGASYPEWDEPANPNPGGTVSSNNELPS